MDKRGLARRLGAGAVRRVLAKRGYDVVRRPTGDPRVPPPDLDDEAKLLFERVRPYTLTSPERVVALRDAVRYVVEAGVSGDIVECGVWRGGSMLAATVTLQALGHVDRELYMYDTWTQMPPPTDRDVDIFGVTAAEYQARLAAGEPLDPVYEYLPLEEVRRVLASSGYPVDRMHFVQGVVEETIPAVAPVRIAFLRLDTDYYESTRHELVHLFPRLSDGAVLLIDDYGHWKGSREAVDEYLAEHGISLLLHRIDYSGRIAVVRVRE